MKTGARRGEARVLTVPNALTLVRFGCIPVFVWLVAEPHREGWLAAAVLLGALGATDGVDGFLARRLGQVSTVGKVLDPVADRLLLLSAAVAIIAVGAVPTWLAVVAVVRELLVAAGFLIVAAAGGRRVDVRWAGKAGTFGLMCALPLFLAGHAGVSWHEVAEVLGWVSAIPGLAFGWWAAVRYVPLARGAVAEGRRDRIARAAVGEGATR